MYAYNLISCMPIVVDCSNNCQLGAIIMLLFHLLTSKLYNLLNMA